MYYSYKFEILPGLRKWKLPARKVMETQEVGVSLFRSDLPFNLMA